VIEEFQSRENTNNVGPNKGRKIALPAIDFRLLHRSVVTCKKYLHGIFQHAHVESSIIDAIGEMRACSTVQFRFRSKVRFPICFSDFIHHRTKTDALGSLALVGFVHRQSIHREAYNRYRLTMSGMPRQPIRNCLARPTDLLLLPGCRRV